jgi:rhombotail lipoprotein
MTTRFLKPLCTVLVAGTLLTVSGCAPAMRTTTSSSLVDYLYPKGDLPPAYEDSVPNLPLPLNVGIAFVPGTTEYAPSEARKNELLTNTQAAFKGRPYIRQIEVIPDVYMRSGKGFSTVDQVARLFNLDVIVLVSYDQVENTDPNTLSLSYLTIVGAYLIPGSRHEASTFVDAAVFDVRTHKLLFRAAGVNAAKGHSTGVGEDLRRRELMDQGFVAAMTEMTTNLNQEVDAFKVRIKEDKSVSVSHRDNYTGGGGAIDGWSIAVLGLLVWLQRVRATWRSTSPLSHRSMWAKSVLVPGSRYPALGGESKLNSVTFQCSCNAHSPPNGLSISRHNPPKRSRHI